MEAVIQPSALKPGGFLGAVVTLCAVTAGTIGIRVWANFNHSGRIFVDDYMSAVALVFLVLNSATCYVLLSTFFENPQDVTIDRLTTLCSLGIFAANCAIYSAKLPLLFLYIRTFGVKKWLEWTCKILVVVSLLSLLSLATWTSVLCSPQLHPSTPLFMFTCITTVTNASIARGGISITVDVILFFLPFPVLKTLNMPFRRKLGLGLVFMAGLLAIIASGLGTYYAAAQTGGTSSNFANSLLMTVIESSVVILVSCAPSLHLFWTKNARALRARMGLSRLSTSTSKTPPGDTSRSMKRKDDVKSFAGSSASTRPIQAHQYIELEDIPGSQEEVLGAQADDNRKHRL